MVMNKTLFFIIKYGITLLVMFVLSLILPLWLAIVITIALFLLFMPVDPPGHKDE
jgi:hypothetical protein